MNETYTFSVTTNCSNDFLNVVRYYDESNNMIKENWDVTNSPQFTFIHTKNVSYYDVEYIVLGDAYINGAHSMYHLSGTLKPQLELGEIATEWKPYSPYIENFSEVTVNVNDKYYYTPTADGTVTGIASVSPTMKIEVVDQTGRNLEQYVNITDFTYCVDTKTYIDKTATGGSGISNWNDLTDKPFYDDGGTVILDYANPPVTHIDLNNVFLGKVTDDLLTADHLNGAKLLLSFTDNGVISNISQELNIDTIQVFNFSFGTAYQFECVTDGTTFLVMIGIASQTGEFDPFGDGNLINIAETGTYMGCVPYGIEIPNSISLEYDFIKTLDIKFIPQELLTTIDQRIENYINEALGGEY